MKALSIVIIATIREWVKKYVDDNLPKTIAFSVNFETGELEYITGSDITFTVNNITGQLEYGKEIL